MSKSSPIPSSNPCKEDWYASSSDEVFNWCCVSTSKDTVADVQWPLSDKED